GEGGGEVDGAEDDHPGRWGERLDEDGHALLPAGFTVETVVAPAGPARLQLAEGVAGHDPVEVRVAQAADRVALGPDQELGPDPDGDAPGPGPRSLDDGGQSGRLARPQRSLDGVAGLVRRIDEDVDRAAAGEAD